MIISLANATVDSVSCLGGHLAPAVLLSSYVVDTSKWLGLKSGDMTGAESWITACKLLSKLFIGHSQSQACDLLDYWRF
jgi:hypothetical protein